LYARVAQLAGVRLGGTQPQDRSATARGGVAEFSPENICDLD